MDADQLGTLVFKINKSLNVNEVIFNSALTKPRLHKTFFMLNSTDHEIYPAHFKMPTIY